jgi:sugar phosphate isomerase/epimerase
VNKSNPVMLPVSVGSWSFHRLFESQQMNLFGYFQAMKYRYHLHAADIWSGMIASRDPEYIALVARVLEEEQITVSHIAIDEARAWDSDAEARQAQHRIALYFLQRIAPEWKAASIRIDMGPRATELTPEQFDAIVTRYQEYARIAGDHGMRIGPQNHYGPTTVATTFLDVYQAVNHPAFGLVLDVGRWPEQADDSDRRVAPTVFHTHFDRSSEGLRLEQKLQTLVDAGYQGCWSLEHRSGNHEYAEVALDLATLQRALVHLA